MQVSALIQKHKQSPRIVILEAVCQFVVLLLSTFFGFSIFAAGFSFAFGKFAHYCVVLLHAPLCDRDKKKLRYPQLVTFPGKSWWSVSIIAWLAYDKKEGGENITQNLGSCQKVIPRRIIIIETANKIINKQGKIVMFDFLQIVVIYAI